MTFIAGGKSLLSEGLSLLMDKTWEDYLRCSKRNDECGMSHHRAKAEKIIAEYIALNGRGCASYVQGVDVEKGDVFSKAKLMEITF